MPALSPPAYVYTCVGNPRDVTTPSRAGLALVGGGGNVDEAFRWMLERSGGGDVVVLRASGDGELDPYLYRLGAHVDSVETIVCRDRSAAFDPFVVAKIRNAEAVFIAGGDQWNYVRYWEHSPLLDALSEVAARAPLGGTSAGLAILGEWVYDARNGGVSTAEALAHTDEKRVTLDHDFMHLPDMAGIVTDTHFQQRDRMGRLCSFLAHVPGEAHGIGVNERTAVLIEPGGAARVVGESAAFFVRKPLQEAQSEGQAPLTVTGLEVQRVDAGRTFDVRLWKGHPSKTYHIDAINGKLSSDQAGHEMY